MKYNVFIPLGALVENLIEAVVENLSWSFCGRQRRQRWRRQRQRRLQSRSPTGGKRQHFYMNIKCLRHQLHLPWNQAYQWLQWVVRDSIDSSTASRASLTLSSVLAKIFKMPILLDRCSQNDGFESTYFAFSTNQDFDMYLCFWTSRLTPRYEIKIVSLESRVLKMVCHHNFQV